MIDKLHSVKKALEEIKVNSEDTLKIIGHPSLAGIEFEIILETSVKALAELNEVINIIRGKDNE